MSEKKRTYEDAVEISVKWWSEKAFDIMPNQNNGDDSEDSGVSSMLMNLGSCLAQEKITPEIMERFERKLTEIL